MVLWVIVTQLPLRAITPIARTSTSKENYPHRKVNVHNLNCTDFTDYKINRGEYSKVVGILELVEKKREISLVCYEFQSLPGISKVSASGLVE